MVFEFWFLAPLLTFFALSGYRLGVAYTHFKDGGDLPGGAADVISGSAIGVEIIASILTAAGGLLGGAALGLPDPVVAFGLSAALLLAVGGFLGLFMRFMLPRYFVESEKVYRFPGAFYPGVKAVFGAAHLALAAFIVIFVFWVVFAVVTESVSLESESTSTEAATSADG